MLWLKNVMVEKLKSPFLDEPLYNRLAKTMTGVLTVEQYSHPWNLSRVILEPGEWPSADLVLANPTLGFVLENYHIVSSIRTVNGEPVSYLVWGDGGEQKVCTTHENDYYGWYIPYYHLLEQGWGLEPVFMGSADDAIDGLLDGECLVAAVDRISDGLDHDVIDSWPEWVLLAHNDVDWMDLVKFMSSIESDDWILEESVEMDMIEDLIYQLDLLDTGQCQPGFERGSWGCVVCDIGTYSPDGFECLECATSFVNGSSICPVCSLDGESVGLDQEVQVELVYIAIGSLLGVILFYLVGRTDRCQKFWGRKRRGLVQHSMIRKLRRWSSITLRTGHMTPSEKLIADLKVEIRKQIMYMGLELADLLSDISAFWAVVTQIDGYGSFQEVYSVVIAAILFTSAHTIYGRWGIVKNLEARKKTGFVAPQRQTFQRLMTQFDKSPMPKMARNVSVRMVAQKLRRKTSIKPSVAQCDKMIRTFVQLDNEIEEQCGKVRELKSDRRALEQKIFKSMDRNGLNDRILELGLVQLKKKKLRIEVAAPPTHFLERTNSQPRVLSSVRESDGPSTPVHRVSGKLEPKHPVAKKHLVELKIKSLTLSLQLAIIEDLSSIILNTYLVATVDDIGHAGWNLAVSLMFSAFVFGYKIHGYYLRQMLLVKKQRLELKTMADGFNSAVNL